jgi:hypothetical protein
MVGTTDGIDERTSGVHGADGEYVSIGARQIRTTLSGRHSHLQLDTGGTRGTPASNSATIEG